ncbi:hypothetical protein [Pedobacter rhizosphaerae]|uniref:Uncharacterized protein n=1 Tax=Pedobacter rhizosphaerae TaxID=390241 RepID=A0A1H9N5I8_9SPHI|nr:hypothetical protein [Pedobacter rhizosphaerae]SER31158.1 hypothetical protein SAMN04488023_10754 [Pedobacter rhizosphaerae]
MISEKLENAEKSLGTLLMLMRIDEQISLNAEQAVAYGVEFADELPLSEEGDDDG